MGQDIHWKQRFQNYEQAFLRLSQALHQDSLNEFEDLYTFFKHGYRNRNERQFRYHHRS